MRLAATNPELVRGIVLTGVPLLRPETAAAKPAFGFRALRFLNKWHFISNDRHGEGAPQARLGRLPRGRGRDA